MRSSLFIYSYINIFCTHFVHCFELHPCHYKMSQKISQSEVIMLQTKSNKIENEEKTCKYSEVIKKISNIQQTLNWMQDPNQFKTIPETINDQMNERMSEINTAIESLAHVESTFSSITSFMREMNQIKTQIMNMIDAIKSCEALCDTNLSLQMHIQNQIQQIDNKINNTIQQIEFNPKTNNKPAHNHSFREHNIKTNCQDTKNGTKIKSKSRIINPTPSKTANKFVDPNFENIRESKMSDATPTVGSSLKMKFVRKANNNYTIVQRNELSNKPNKFARMTIVLTDFKYNQNQIRPHIGSLCHSEPLSKMTESETNTQMVTKMETKKRKLSIVEADEMFATPNKCIQVEDCNAKTENSKSQKNADMINDSEVGTTAAANDELQSRNEMKIDTVSTVIRVQQNERMPQRGLIRVRDIKTMLYPEPSRQQIWQPFL